MHFFVSKYATASPLHQEVFYTVPRAGHLTAAEEHRIRRDHFPGHELILCLQGSGFARVHNATHQVMAGDLVWINCHRPHEHGGNAGEGWEVLWVRVDGPGLERMCDILSVAERPVFGGFPVEEARRIYERVFDLMESSAPYAPAQLHAEVAQLLALIFAARNRTEAQLPVSPVLRPAVEAMKLFYFETHRVAELAGRCGLSPSHFARLFRAAFGTSPIDWLRRERVNQAKRRLTESRDAIEEIATQVGYSDRFFFSRDFKKLTGFSPREFRNRERSRSGQAAR